MTREHTDDRILYTATAHNRTGPDGESWADGGLRVAVRSPLAPPDTASPATNPEELLALAWATCLSGSARIVAGEQRQVAVRVEVGLREDGAGPGYCFAPTAYLAFSGATAHEAAALAAAAHARCPMSKLLTGTATVIAEPFAPE